MPNISNMSPAALTPEERRFVEDVAEVLCATGFTPAAALIFGYLLTRSTPVSLDDMTAALGISKSSASVAARLLESQSIAKRRRERGTKRALYEIAIDYEAAIQRHRRFFTELGARMGAGADIATSKDVKARLKAVSAFYAYLSSAVQNASVQWSAEGRLKPDSEPLAGKR
jgi:predicted transcriptional regulator